MSADRMAPDKEVRRVVTAARRAGWDVDKKSNGHITLTAPNGERISVSCSPSAQNSIRAYRARFARIMQRMKEQQA